MTNLSFVERRRGSREEYVVFMFWIRLTELHMKIGFEKPERRIVRGLALVLLSVYVVIVTVFLLLKWRVGLFSSASSLELIIGPAITVLSGFLLCMAGFSLRIKLGE